MPTFYTAPTADELAARYSNYPPPPSQQQEAAITQLCGEVNPTHYHYHFFNIILVIVVVVSGVILIKRNSTTIPRYIKDNSLKIILIIAVATLASSLVLSVFVQKSEIRKFEANTIKSFFYTTSDRIPENEVTKYVECRTNYLTTDTKQL